MNFEAQPHMPIASVIPATLVLPPLILHPFADHGGPSRLLESSRASLMLQGLLSPGDYSPADLERRVLDGRYCELRMLFYVGRDLTRWIEQCMEWVERRPDLKGERIRRQSFAAFLIDATPDTAKAKLRKWGVTDYKSIFRRALGLNTVFAEAPERSSLSDDFIRNYYRYADEMFRCSQEQASYADLAALGFEFELYASGEYSRMLEREWGERSDD